MAEPDGRMCLCGELSEAFLRFGRLSTDIMHYDPVNCISRNKVAPSDVPGLAQKPDPGPTRTRAQVGLRVALSFLNDPRLELGPGPGYIVDEHNLWLVTVGIMDAGKQPNTIG
jgi:hypothetical protein